MTAMMSVPMRLDGDPIVPTIRQPDEPAATPAGASAATVRPTAAASPVSRQPGFMVCTTVSPRTAGRRPKGSSRGSVTVSQPAGGDINGLISALASTAQCGANTFCAWRA